jgi:hypothetical protein
MNTKLASILMFLALSINPALAVTIKGAISCGTWIKYGQTGGIDKAFREAKLLAYLSGLAVATNRDIFEGTSNDSIFLWVDNYCQKNPLEDIYDAGNYLFVELSTRNKTK